MYSFSQLNTLSYSLSVGLFKELKVSVSLGYYVALANMRGGAESCVLRVKIPLFCYIQWLSCRGFKSSEE